MALTKVQPNGVATYWDTSAKTSSFTAEANRGYFLDTTSASITLTLPASPSVGNFVAWLDVSATADTNAVTIARNSSKINGGTDDVAFSTERGALVLVFSGSTQGWVVRDDANIGGDTGVSPPYSVETLIVAGGGSGMSGIGNGNGSGGGGGMGDAGSHTRAGANGAAGIVIIYEYSS